MHFLFRNQCRNLRVLTEQRQQQQERQQQQQYQQDEQQVGQVVIVLGTEVFMASQ